MRSSIRNRLLATFVGLVVITGAGTLYLIERQIADDLVAALDARLTSQGRAIATQMTNANHPHNLAVKLGSAAGARITVVGADGLVQGDSVEPELVGRPIGDAAEVSWVRRHRSKGRAIRRLHPDEPLQYLVAVAADFERVVRLSVPLDDIIDTRARMRNRLLVAAGFGLVGALVLAFLLIRAITRPLASMTR
ncbi:MAG: hypothetical protein NT062_20720, partial [Proteobacteria bacterium]|nr:hypothetical protein [Pseudomonadota bacterium]